MTRSTSIVAAAFAASIASGAFAQAAEDVGLTVKGGAIRSAAATSDGFGPDQRAFVGRLGAAGVPWFSADTSFEAAPGTFPAGSHVGVRFAAPLMAWDGTGFVANSTSGPSSNERLRLSYLSLEAVSGDGPAPGFELPAQSDGSWDIQPTMELLAAPGAWEPKIGVYLLQLEVYSDSPAIAVCQPLWIVLNAEAGETELQAAYAFARAEVDVAACPADVNADRAVDGTDLGIMLAGWGTPGAADINGDGIVDSDDLGVLLGAWGPCP